MGTMGAMVLTTTTIEFSVFPNILKKSPIAHMARTHWRDGRYFQYPPKKFSVSFFYKITIWQAFSWLVFGLSIFSHKFERIFFFFFCSEQG
jgi:hypothetical protein